MCKYTLSATISSLLRGLTLTENCIAKFSPKFLADRQPRLQRFLRAVMLHPEMGQGGEGSVIGQWVLDTSTQRNAR